MNVTPADFRSVYVHIPFCARVCPYCDFAVVAGRDEVTERYLSALRREIHQSADWGPLHAVFVGGGTPSRVPGIVDVVVDLIGRFGVEGDCEITLEANPEDWTPDLARTLVAAGFTRVSFGAQSLDDEVLASLGRRHEAAAVGRAVTEARAAGFRSISVDCIFGTPGESLESWRTTIEGVVSMQVDHVSTYALTVEPPTPLGRAVRRGAPAPDPDDQADKWELAVEILAAAGFERYEVSNHALPGHRCKYNLGVWYQGEYLGFGLGAHGFRDGVRTRNVRRLDTYLERVESGVGPVQASDNIAGWSAEQERLMLGLRLASGVEAGPAGRALLQTPDGRRLTDAGVLTLENDTLRVSRPLLTDEAIRALLAVADPGLL